MVSQLASVSLKLIKARSSNFDDNMIFVKCRRCENEMTNQNPREEITMNRSLGPRNIVAGSKESSPQGILLKPVGVKSFGAKLISTFPGGVITKNLEYKIIPICLALN